MMAADDPLERLSPNALLILLTIDALSSTGSLHGPKSDDVGWAAGRQEASWVHRHGRILEEGLCEDRHLARFSANGHCHLSKRGADLAHRIRTAVPPDQPRETCTSCGIGKIGPCVHGRQLYECGRVAQWCPDHIPGLPKAELNPRSVKAQHQGIWFTASWCLQSYQRNPNRTSDGTDLHHGLSVQINHGSGKKHKFMDADGTVMSASAGVALVDWPAVGDEPAVHADIVRANQLVLLGALDITGLSAHQSAVYAARVKGDATFTWSETGVWTGTLNGRTINKHTIRILAERGLLDPAPSHEPTASLHR